MENELVKIVKKSGLEKTKAQYMLDNFTDFFEIAKEWEIKAKAIKITNATQITEMKMAREARLFLRGKRIDVEKARKKLKEQSKREGKAIDGVANVLKALIVPIEEHLKNQENFVKIQEAERRAKIVAEADAKAERERIAKEKAEEAERKAEEERIKLENIKLKEEAEKREKIMQKEREEAKREAEKREKIMQKEREEAKREAEKREKIMQKEREEAKREAEKREKIMQKEREEREKIESDKRKLEEEQRQEKIKLKEEADEREKIAKEEKFVAFLKRNNADLKDKMFHIEYRGDETRLYKLLDILK